jgi:hypothetical protein
VNQQSGRRGSLGDDNEGWRYNALSASGMTQEGEATMSDEVLYFLPEDLYRIGNATSPLMTRIRAGEITLMDINGVATIVANNKRHQPVQ